ncbi:MAG TPA: VWA domain-containing protein, partial [Actinomycetota bacterium]|nr:VWA domain-containing protein [Actinomycetota bacterium]
MTPARYSRWDGSQDPWADADALLDSLSDDVLEFGDLQQALRRMLQRGFDLDGRRITGVQSLAERLRALRRHELQAHDMDSVVSGIEDALREVREMESREVDERMRLRDEEHPGGSGRSVPAADDPLDALEREMARPPFGPRLDVRSEWLDRLEGRPGEALRSLQSYDFLSPEAESKFRELVDGLRSQVMQQYFKGAEQALSNLTPEAVERTKAMLSELNDMIRRREDRQPYDFDGFMQRHGEFFPDNPRDLDQLLEGLARRMAMAQAMMASMSPEMRARLEEMMGALMADADLSFQMNELTHALRGMLPPGMWDRGLPFEGSDPLDMSRAMEVLERLQEAEDLEQYLRGVTRPGDLDEVDLDRVSSLLGPEAARDLKRLQEIERMLEDAGYVQRSRGRLDITPQGVRRIGRQALGSVYSRLKAALAGDHQIPRSGRGGDLTGETKPYEFGDPFHIEVKQTVFEAVRRSGAGTPVRIRPEDFQVERTEHRVQA